jgi:glutamine cyclotransferase
MRRTNRRHRVCLLGLLTWLAAVLLCSCTHPPEAGQTHTPDNGTSPVATRAAITAERNLTEDATPPIPTSTAHAVTSEPIPVYSYEIVNVYPHDRNAYTQGLVFEDGILYEGTGLRGQSTLRRVALETGAVLQLYALPAQFFGEGVTVFGDKIFQLTWQSNVGFVYDKHSFQLLQQFYYPTEGWGITHDGERLIMSDGTSTLHFLDPETLKEIGRIQVYDSGGPVVRLNELEYVQGEIYANVWQTDRIARIDPDTGQVIAWIELEGLLGPEDLSQPVDLLNGIAYDAQHERLFVTGKKWPELFEIKLIPTK